MRPVNRGANPTERQGQPKKYTEYGYARRDLIERLGEYCSYCEMHLDSSLAVEHVQPKKHHEGLALSWSNFLLGCTNCNSTKGDKDPDLNSCIWPDLDNSFLAFEYSEDGRVCPKVRQPEELVNKARAMIDLVGLDKTPDAQNASDRRWRNRQEAWEIAEESKQDLAECDCEPMRRSIVRTAVAKGYWSIWMTVFTDDSDMLNRLIQSYPGTAQDCFDANGQPVPRPGGQL